MKRVLLMYGVLLACAMLAILLSSQSAVSATSGPHWHDESGEQRFRDLTTYEEIKRKLTRIERQARNKIVVGPLIENGDNGGLIDIDVDLHREPSMPADICSRGTSTRPSTRRSSRTTGEPSVRQAVICTINDGGRGNQDPTQVGFSTQGRELWAARLGNTHGLKVMIITQQHGNEVRSTEAALKVIRELTKRKRFRPLLRKLNILFVVRANPDGGEPSRECFIGTPNGTVIEEDCALTRTNVDPQAGGGYAEDSEADFSGAVGVGYNLNRYHFVDLQHPIRPHEAQAMVAVALAWRPEVVLDLHGDLQKTSCSIDSKSIVPGAILGAFPSALCQAESEQTEVVFSPILSELNEDGGIQQNRSRSLAAGVAKKIDRFGFGTVNRFGQIRAGTGTINDGSTFAYGKIGAIVGGWESVNFAKAIAFPVQQVVNGMPVRGVSPNLFLDGHRFRRLNTRMNEVAMMESLRIIASWRSTKPVNESGYCDIPLTTAINVAFPEEFFGPNQAFGPFLVPLIGPLLQTIDNCSNNPS